MRLLESPARSKVRHTRRLVWAACALIALWTLLSYLIVPKLLGAAYQGEGLGVLLTPFMEGREATPFEAYLQDWIDIRWRVFTLLIGALVLAGVATWNGWNLGKHWFDAAPLKHLALARIVLVGIHEILLLWPKSLGACPGCNLGYQYMLSRVDARLFEPLPIVNVMLLPFGWGVRPDPLFMHGVWLLAALSGFCALIGFCGRSSLLVLAWTSTVLIGHSYSYGEHHHTEALLILSLWALAFSPCTERLSLDGRLRHGGKSWNGRELGQQPVTDTSVFARWPFQLVLWLLALSYFDAGVSKLANGGLDWFQGHTLAYYFARDAIARGHPLGIWLSENATLLTVLSVFGVVFELTFPLAIVIPRLIPVYALAGISFHAAIYLIHGPPFVQHLALLSILLIAPLPKLRYTWIKSPRPAGV